MTGVKCRLGIMDQACLGLFLAQDGGFGSMLVLPVVSRSPLYRCCNNKSILLYGSDLRSSHQAEFTHVNAVSSWRCRDLGIDYDQLHTKVRIVLALLCCSTRRSTHTSSNRGRTPDLSKKGWLSESLALVCPSATPSSSAPLYHHYQHPLRPLI